MVLGSQTPRAGVSRRYMSSSRRGGRHRLLIGGAVAVLLGLAIWLLLPGDDDTTDAAEPAPVAGEVQTPAGLTPTVAPAQPDPPAPQIDRFTTGDPSTSNSSQEPIRPALTPTNAPNRTGSSTQRPAPQPVNQPAATPTRTRTVSAPAVAQRIEQARTLVTQGKLVDARSILNTALHSQISRNDAAVVRQQLMKINDQLIFSGRAEIDDPLVEIYTIQSGDLLSRIARKYDTSWEFLARINNIADPRRIRVGQKIKVIKGPFHLVVHKADFRVDAYLKQGDTPIYIRSFRAGLGKDDSTPLGKFIVKRGGKLADPPWTDPYTGEHFASANPLNPIGDFWVGLRGNEPATETLSGYGLHGTIEPQTIGTEASRGCVRMLPDDIKLIFYMMIEEKSEVTILP